MKTFNDSYIINTVSWMHFFFLKSIVFIIMAHDYSIFRIICDLLRLNVAPAAIERMLRSMTSSNQPSHKRKPLAASDGKHTGILIQQ